MAAGTGTRSRQVLAVIAAGAALVGYLLSSGALDPALTAAVNRITDRHTARPQEPHLARVSQWTSDPGSTMPHAPEWSRQRLVPAGPSSPARPQAPIPPQIQVPEDPLHWRWQYPHPSTPRITLAPMPSCSQYHGPSATIALHLSGIAGGSVAVDWWDLGDPDTTSYRIGVLPVDATPSDTVTWHAVAAPHTCKTVTATVRGLTAGRRYQLWLEAYNTDPIRSMTYQRTIGRSESFLAS